MIWHILRLNAIARHRIWWRTFDGADPEAWQSHMALIRMVYGY